MRLLAVHILLATAGLSTSTLAAEPVSDIGYSWQGLYFGGQLGYATFKGEDNLGSPTATLESAIGGAHLGYNHAFGQFVLGLEAEGNLTDFNSTTSAGFESNIDWVLATRVRAGYSFDRVLAYVTTGASVTQLEFDSPARGTSDSNVHTGLLLGAGIEAFLTKRISTRVEYQHTWYNSQTYNMGGIDFDVDGDSDIVRAGVSLHF